MKANLVNENFTQNYLKNLLITRGVTDIENFLNPTQQNLNDPTLLDNIVDGAALLTKIIQKENSKILLIVDCDVDGFTSAAIIYTYIKSIAPT